MVIELASEETADWVRLEDVRNTFEESFGGSAKIKDQLFQVVVNFLPVTLRDVLEHTAPKLEFNNSLPSDCIANCRWLKAPRYWTSGQRFAHAIISVKGRLEASLLICHGVIIEGQRFRVRKMLEEPRRCFKCQRTGHMAAGCKEIHEICPNCSGAHAGKDCSKQPKDFRCINCIKAKLPAGHAVWDRNCSSMLEARKKIAERSPESRYKFFPTEEDWTWERKEDSKDDSGAGQETVTEQLTSQSKARGQSNSWTGTPDGG